MKSVLVANGTFEITEIVPHSSFAAFAPETHDETLTSTDATVFSVVQVRFFILEQKRGGGGGGGNGEGGKGRGGERERREGKEEQA